MDEPVRKSVRVTCTNYGCRYYCETRVVRLTHLGHGVYQAPDLRCECGQRLCYTEEAPVG